MLGGVLALVMLAADTTQRFVSPDSGYFDPAVVQAVAPAPIASALLTPTPVDSISAVPALRWTFAAPDTQPRKKRVLVEYSDWYGRRLAVHRTLTWAMIPLFAVSYYTGERLLRDGRINSPYAVRALHPYAATGAAVVFGINTFTGVWNLWDGRHDPEGRTRRFAHSILFMLADAGFAYAGSIGEEARENGAIRSRHRTVALSSMGVSYIGMMLMLLGGK